MTNKILTEIKTLIKSGERREKLYWNTLNLLINSTICQVMLTKKPNTLQVSFKPQGDPFLICFLWASEEPQLLQGEALSYEIHSSILIWLHGHSQKHHAAGRAFSDFTSINLQWPCAPAFPGVWWSSELLVAVLHAGLARVAYITVVFIIRKHLTDRPWGVASHCENCTHKEQKKTPHACKNQVKDPIT